MDKLEHADILIVEDNEADFRLVEEAILEGQFDTKLYHAWDGEEALAFLYKEHPFENVPVPNIILLDLNLPKVDGREVLAKIKEHPRLRLIPVVIMTTSEAEEDVIKTYEHHANCYIRKPVDFEEFVEVVQLVSEFWFRIVTLPKIK